jgi:hypothetical protein
MATLQMREQTERSAVTPTEIELPAPTPWPFVFAFGLTLLFAGLLTSAAISVLGAVLMIAAGVGWFREVFPHEHEQAVRVTSEEPEVVTERHIVDRVPVAADRAWLPVRTHPVSAGVKGGLAGSVAMAILACTYGVLKTGSIWYPINLLAAVIYTVPEAGLNSFDAWSFVIALVLHGLVSTLVGLLYGAMLPTFARRPILLGGLIGPVLWSGLLYTILGLLNPLLESHIDWVWFIASQVAFGVVAGLVVIRSPRVPTRENVSFAVRAGIRAPGIIPPEGSGERRP